MSYPIRKYLVEDIFAVGSVNLLAGMSGAGKSRFMFQSVEELEKQQSLLTYKILSEVRCKYFAFDRSQQACWDLLTRMKCFPKCPIVSILSQTKSFDDLCIPTREEIGDANFVILDGFDFAVKGNVIDLRTVGRLLFQCGRLAEDLGICILGALGTAKVKGMDSYDSPREKILGSSAWARLCETILIMEKPNDAVDDKSRNLLVLPRNNENTSLALTFNKQGRLIPSVMAEPSAIEYKFLESLPPFFTFKEAVEFGEKHGIRKTTVYEILKKFKEQKLVTSTGKGGYKRAKVN